MNIFNELKRRNVFRAAGLYIVIGWALAQAASLLENALTLPLWFDALVISLLLLGFPLAVIFAWAYEMTPEGLKPTKEISADASIAPVTGKKLDMAILAGLGVLIALLVADRFLDRTDAKVIAIGGQGKHAALADNSIAVLPFTDMSSEQDQQYFSDGISEELLNVLGQVRDLRVAGRTSSFAFKGQNKDLKEIGEILDVGYIVEGSIRKSGNKVRVTAQLVQANDGYRQWSSTYDRNLDDIFAVQDEIARSVAAAVGATLEGDLRAPHVPASVEAYERFLQGEFHYNRRLPADLERAAEYYRQAIALDPAYARAWAALAGAYSLIIGEMDQPDTGELRRLQGEAARKAVELDPGLAFGTGGLRGRTIGRVLGHHADAQAAPAIRDLRTDIGRIRHALVHMRAHDRARAGRADVGDPGRSLHRADRVRGRQGDRGRRAGGARRHQRQRGRGPGRAGGRAARGPAVRRPAGAGEGTGNPDRRLRRSAQRHAG